MSRPSLDLRILVRARLAQRLPESPGHTVWLQAPYGYGKSVLAAQWADELEAQGWRVLWPTPAENSLKAGLANLLDLPLDLPWAELEERLWQHPTLLVLDDLSSDSLSSDGSSAGGFSVAEELGSLIRHNRGLLLVASRRDVPHPELMNARTRGRLTRLSAADLAFTADESEMLFDRSADGHAAWSQARGWPLPLHWAALTGETPSVRALLRAVRASLAQSEWEEFLFLSALDHLPREAATAATQRLAATLFIQELEASYHLHALPGEGVLADYQAESPAWSWSRRTGFRSRSAPGPSSAPDCWTPWPTCSSTRARLCTTRPGCCTGTRWRLVHADHCGVNRSATRSASRSPFARALRSYWRPPRCPRRTPTSGCSATRKPSGIS
jgi:hypothetical protein